MYRVLFCLAILGFCFQSKAAQLVCLTDSIALTAYIETDGQVSRFAINNQILEAKQIGSLTLDSQPYFLYSTSAVVFALPQSATGFEDHESFSAFVIDSAKSQLTKLDCRQSN